MKLIKKVNTIEAKRCFVLSNCFTSKKMEKVAIKKRMAKPDKGTFKDEIKKRKVEILGLKESELDKIIATEYKKRLKAYDSLDWYIGYAKISEVGLWGGAGGIPKTWTKGSLKDSAKRVSEELANKKSKYSRIRAIRTIPKIIACKSIVKAEKYLMPIILPGGTISNCRKGMEKMKGDVDDGCMRSLSFTISGDKEIKAYIGKQKLISVAKTKKPKDSKGEISKYSKR